MATPAISDSSLVLAASQLSRAEVAQALEGAGAVEQERVRGGHIGRDARQQDKQPVLRFFWESM